MKQFRLLLLTVTILLGISVTAFASPDRLVDEADLLTPSEEEILRTQLDEISTRQEFDVVVLTTNSLYGDTPEAYAESFYDSHDYGYGVNGDGAILLVSMEERDWYLSTCGYGRIALPEDTIDQVSDLFVPKLSEGDYLTAFTDYATACDVYVTQAKTDFPYDGINLPRDPFPLAKSLLISLIVGVVLAFIIVMVMKGKLKTVRPQHQADDYLKQGSFQLTNRQDIFLYHTVHRTARPKDNSSGGSRSSGGGGGRSHGGGGGKF